MRKKKAPEEEWVNPLEARLEGLNDAQKASLITADWVLARMAEAISGVGIWRFAKPAQINKTLEMLLIHKGMLVQKKQVNIDIQAMMRQVPGDQLKEIVDAEVITERLIEGGDSNSGSNGRSGGLGV